jgi:hypothetical protein
LKVISNQFQLLYVVKQDGVIVKMKQQNLKYKYDYIYIYIYIYENERPSYNYMEINKI